MLALVGGKCGKPKAPKEQAVEVVQQAWQQGDVALQLGDDHEVLVTLELEDLEHLDVDDERVVINFSLHGDAAEAELVVAGEHFVLQLTSEGDVVEPE